MKILFEIGPLVTKVSFDGMSGTQRNIVRTEIDRVTSFHKKGYHFSKPYREGRWDGKRHLFRDDMFPTGLFFTVYDRLAKKDMEDYVEVGDLDALTVDIPVYMIEPLDGMPFYPYQHEANEIVCKNVRGVFQLATNAGKTYIMRNIIQTFGGYQKTLVLVPNKTLLHQTAEALRSGTGAGVGVVGDGQRDTSQMITVASVSALGSWIPERTVAGVDGERVKIRKSKGLKDWHSEVVDFLETVECLMVDEVHHIGTNDWYKVAMLCPAKYRYGFSGTAFDRTDEANMMIEASCGPLLLKVTNKQLIDLGISCPVKVFRHEERSIIVRKSDVNGKYPELYSQCITMNMFRNQSICEIAEREVSLGRQVLISVKSRDHGSVLEEMLDQRYMFEDDDVIYVHGDIDGEDRQCVIEAFNEGIVKVIIATDVFKEGVDTPNIDTLIRGDAGKSKIADLQWVGRGTRQKEGKVLHLHDFMDYSNRIFEKQSSARFRAYTNESFEFVKES